MTVLVKWKDQNIQPNITSFDCALWDAYIDTQVSYPILSLFKERDKTMATIPMENILYFTVQD